MREIWDLSWKSSFHNKLGHVVCIISSSVLRRSPVKTSFFALWWVFCFFVFFFSGHKSDPSSCFSVLVLPPGSHTMASSYV